MWGSDTIEVQVINGRVIPRSECVVAQDDGTDQSGVGTMYPGGVQVGSVWYCYDGSTCVRRGSSRRGWTREWASRGSR